MLNEKDLEFIKKRSFFARWWNVVGSVMLAVLVGMALWFFVRVPNFINPFHVIDQLQSGTLQQSTLVVMAAMLPIVVLGLLLVCCTVIGFGFAVFANERRYLRIIEEMQKAEENENA
jgi:Ca2+/Na+ antiporter